MKKLAIGLAFALTFLSVSLAQAQTVKKKKHVPPDTAAVTVVQAPKPASWTGPYIGLFGSYTASGKITMGYNGTSGTDSNLGGFGGGIQAGYDTQLENAVIGAAVELNMSGANDSYSGTVAGYSYSDSYTMPTTWVARGRLGFLTSDNMLIYLTGGLAYGSRKASLTISNVNFNDTENQTGYLIGGGLEYRLTSNTSAFAEYRYYGFNSANYTIATLPLSIQDNENEVRLGLNYRF